MQKQEAEKYVADARAAVASQQVCADERSSVAFWIMGSKTNA